jgi:drug/metabolite transporter (DMT)-like permease
VQAGVAAWLSALVVAVVTIGVGYLLVNRGVAALSATSLVPTKTIETLKEDARWTTRQGA